jgi:hypothetical protein
MLQEREHRYDIPNEAVELRYNAAEKRREHMRDLIIKGRERLITDAQMKALMAEDYAIRSNMSGSGGPFKAGVMSSAGAGVDSSRLGTTAVSHRLGSNDSAGSPPGKEGVLEKELRAIQKIREKQRKEVEQMIDYEMRLQGIH